MHPESCVNGHPQRGPVDYFDDGQCRHCDRTNQRRYRSRRGAAMELAMALEANGIPVTRADPPIDRKQLAALIAALIKAANRG